LQNRPDIRQAELELQAAKVELQASKANFYPSLRISANAGTQAFGASYLFHPSAALYSILADAFVPLVNRNAITAAYLNADAKQKQALIRYEQRTLNAFFEVQSQIIKGENFVKSFETKQKEVDILSNSVEIANSLYRSARADYMEILLTQREMLDEKIELVEIRTKVLMTKVNRYRALGGGWR
jgi:outer membrane protein TolC